MKALTHLVPTKTSRFYVSEKVRFGIGKTLTKFIAGPFESPDEARAAYHEILSVEPGRDIACIEAVCFDI